MCGFLVVGSEEFKLQEFNDALDKAAYRGPDHQHISVSNGITWGFNRLSIMDLSTNGNQPFVYKDCTLVCNGEIYNYPELKNKYYSRPNGQNGRAKKVELYDVNYNYISSFDCMSECAKYLTDKHNIKTNINTMITAIKNAALNNKVYKEYRYKI